MKHIIERIYKCNLINLEGKRDLAKLYKSGHYSTKEVLEMIKEFTI